MENKLKPCPFCTENSLEQEGEMTTKPKGVMIVGMDMPKKCCECFCCNIRYAMDKEHNWVVDFAECNILKRTATRTKRPSWCPLQEVK